MFIKRQIYREETQRKILHLLILFPNHCNRQSWTGPKEEARASFWSLMWVQEPKTGSSSAAFPGHSQGAGRTWGRWESPAIWDPGIEGIGLAVWAILRAPRGHLSVHVKIMEIFKKYQKYYINLHTILVIGIIKNVLTFISI